jgi:hypothetical protein
MTRFLVVETLDEEEYRKDTYGVGLLGTRVAQRPKALEGRLLNIL